jgi:hypothetical protein
MKKRALRHPASEAGGSAWVSSPYAVLWFATCEIYAVLSYYVVHALLAP